MTTSRDSDRLLRAWLDLMPDEAPDRVIASVLQATATAPQARVLPWHGPRRSFVNRLSLAAVAAVLVVLVGGGLVLTRFTNNQNNGGPPTPVPSVAPSPTARPTSAPFAAMPDLVLGDWHADNVSIPGITGPQLVRLSLNWDKGLDGWIQLDGDQSYRQVLQFHSLTAADGELRVRSDTTPGCNAGDEGRYGWVRSADGLFLTLQAIQDGCQTRATAFARTWVHSLTAVTDGGLGVLPENPWLEITMPKQRFGASGFGTDASWLHPMSDTDPNRFLMLMVDPLGFDKPCETTRRPIAIRPTTKAFEQYLTGLAGLTVKASAATVDGVAGRRIDVVVDSGLQCASGDMGLFHSRIETETDADWTMPPGQAIYLWTTVKDGHLRVYGFGGDGVTAVDGHTVIDSIRFIQTLPTS